MILEQKGNDRTTKIFKYLFYHYIYNNRTYVIVRTPTYSNQIHTTTLNGKKYTGLCDLIQSMPKNRQMVTTAKLLITAFLD